MKFIFTIFTLLSAVSIFAQHTDRDALNLSIMVFDRALEKKDSVSLNRLLSKDVTYGHSNGWVETKKELIDDLYNGKLSYTRIISSKPDIILSGKVAQARSTAEFYAKLDGEDMYFKLKVLQVWTYENGHWVLFARQSAPLPKG